ncbi:MAG: error-prone DNA polymerase, partial [Hyphomicrobiales bacterium]|nr:error-prone DNA polymerase [Hyphomicrobiales bacterium]
IEGFGEYGFPESHAASFALLVYVSAWIKCHYPEVFCAAILNSQPMGFYQPAQLVRDALKHDVEVRPVDVNFSEWDCTLEPASEEARHRFAVRLGFRQIQGLREKEIEGLVAARGNGYSSIERLGALGGVSRFTIERLAEADAFRSLKLNRREALWTARRLGTLGIDKAIGTLPDAEDAASPAEQDLGRAGKPVLRAPRGGRRTGRATDPDASARPLPLFAAQMDDELFPEARITLPSMPLSEHVVEDYVTTGLSLKEHPVRFFRERLTRLGALRNSEHRREDLPQDGRVTVAGLVLMRQMPGTAKGVVFMTLEDETDIANVIVWPKVFAKHRIKVMTARFIAVRGRLQRAGLVIHVLAEEFIDLTEELRLLSEPDLFASATDGVGPTDLDPPLLKSRDFH